MTQKVSPLFTYFKLIVICFDGPDQSTAYYLNCHILAVQCILSPSLVDIPSLCPFSLEGKNEENEAKNKNKKKNNTQ